jgi:hypothetical protein
MRGEGSARHCDRCDRTVEDLSGRDAAALAARLEDAARTKERACFRMRVDSRTGRLLLATGVAAAALVSTAACTLQVDQPNAPAVHFEPAAPTAAASADAGCPDGGCAPPRELMLVGDVGVE